MVPTAISQVTEAVLKLGAGILFAAVLLSWGFGAEYTAAGAIFGVTMGTLFGAVYLIFSYLRSPKVKEIKRLSLADRDPASKSAIFRSIIKTAVPVTVGASVLSLTNLLDLFLVMNRLGDAGFTQDQAKFLYGSYSSMAVTLFNLPPSSWPPFASALSRHFRRVCQREYAGKNYHRVALRIESFLRFLPRGALCAGPAHF